MKVKENMERKFLISKAGALLLRRRRQSLRRAGFCINIKKSNLKNLFFTVFVKRLMRWALTYHNIPIFSANL